MPTLLEQIALDWSINDEHGYCPVQRDTVAVASCGSCAFVESLTDTRAGTTMTCRPTFSALAKDAGPFLA